MGSRRIRLVMVFLATVAVSGCGEPVVEPAGLALSEALGADTTGYARATGPRPMRFPGDHGPHPDFQLEWWYFTGNLASPEGRRFGYQFTVFRSALAPPGDSIASDSRWTTRQLYSAHFALSDPATDTFRSSERFARGALGLAGAEAEPFRVWIDDWEAGGPGALDSIRVRAHGEGYGIDLVLRPSKPVVLQGESGFSRKGPGDSQASYYYAITRLQTEGTVVSGADTLSVRGQSWFDREWSTSLLGPDQVGWDWFSLQLDDGRDLMLFRLRGRDEPGGIADGSLVDAAGARLPLDASAVGLGVTRTWTSPHATYPAGWTLTVPDHGLELEVTPLMDGQELATSISYWEGAVRVQGSSPTGPVGGYGYVELTGYSEGAQQP